MKISLKKAGGHPPLKTSDPRVVLIWLSLDQTNSFPLVTTQPLGVVIFTQKRPKFLYIVVLDISENLILLGSFTLYVNEDTIYCVNTPLIIRYLVAE